MKKVITIIIVFFSLQISAQCWQKVTGGNAFTVAKKVDGSICAWGNNSANQVGDGTSINRSTPKQIGGTTGNWQSISSGLGFTVALKTDGTLWTWGANNNGTLGNGTFIDISVPTQIGTANDWLMAVAGSVHTLAIKTNGTLWAWGRNIEGQIGINTFSNLQALPVQIGTSSNWQSVAGGNYQSYAIKTDGTLWVCGENQYGQLGLGTTSNVNTFTQVGSTTDWQTVIGGFNHTLAVKTNGTLWAWGRNDVGQLGTGNTTDVNVPVQIGTDTNWQSVDAGLGNSIALKADGTLWTWGSDNYGQLGNGTTTLNANSPTQVGTFSDWQSIGSGTDFCAAIRSNGNLHTWGRNNWSQLGNGNSANGTVPSAISCPTSVLSVDNFHVTNNLKMYPNPIKDTFDLSFDSIINNVSVFNLVGQEVVTKTVNATACSIDISHLPQGNYLVKVTSDAAVKTFKIVKE